jgi:hypothetical protein
MKHADIVAKIRKNANNRYNSIPAGFKRGRKILPGLIKKEIIGITGGLKVGKTKFLLQHYVRNPLQFVKAVNDTAKLDIHYFIVSPQKSEIAWRSMLIQLILFEEHGQMIGFRDIMSVLQQDDRKLNDKIIKLIEQQKDFFDFYDSKVTVIHKTRPSDIIKEIKDWSRSHGSVKFIGDSKENTEWAWDNPNFFPVLVVDPITRLTFDFDPITKSAVDIKGSMTLMLQGVEELCRRMDFCAIIVHPQAPDQERVEADYTGRTKLEKVEPTIGGLAINKQVGEYYSTVIGLFVPYMYRIKDHAKYSVTKLKDNYMSVQILASEYTRKNDRLALWFEGGGGYFEELPKPDELRDANGAFLWDEYDDLIEEHKNKIKKPII